MYCNQCEQTAKAIACNCSLGVCGKTAQVSDLEDVLIHALTGLALFAKEGRVQGFIDEAVYRFMVEGIFSTLTNVDVDPDRFVIMIQRAVELHEAMKQKITDVGGNIAFTHQPLLILQPATLKHWPLKEQRSVFREPGQK